MFYGHDLRLQENWSPCMKIAYHLKYKDRGWKEMQALPPYWGIYFSFRNTSKINHVMPYLITLAGLRSKFSSMTRHDRRQIGAYVRWEYGINKEVAPEIINADADISIIFK